MNSHTDQTRSEGQPTYLPMETATDYRPPPITPDMQSRDSQQTALSDAPDPSLRQDSGYPSSLDDPASTEAKWHGISVTIGDPFKWFSATIR